MRERFIGSVGVVVVGLLPTISGGLPFVLLMTVVGLGSLKELLSLSRTQLLDRRDVPNTIGTGPTPTIAPGRNILIPAAGSAFAALAVLAALALRTMPGSIASRWLTAWADALAFRWEPRPRGLAWTLLVVVAVWVNDTAAYLVGRSFGRHKLAPTVSPNKTVEGAIGGLLGATAVGAAGSLSFGLGIPLPLGGLVGLATGLAGQVGDLAESRLKRWAGVKDSGRLIPGHGGMLDRVDALLFALPLGLLLAWFIDRQRYAP